MNPYKMNPAFGCGCEGAEYGYCGCGSKANPSTGAVVGIIAALAAAGGAAWWLMSAKKDGGKTKTAESAEAPKKESKEVSPGYLEEFRKAKTEAQEAARSSLKLTNTDIVDLMPFLDMRKNRSMAWSIKQFSYKGDIDAKDAGVMEELNVPAATAAKYLAMWRKPRLFKKKGKAVITRDEANKLAHTDKSINEVEGSYETEYVEAGMSTKPDPKRK